MSDMTQDSVPESITPSVASVDPVYYQTPIFHLSIEGSNYDVALTITHGQCPHQHFQLKSVEMAALRHILYNMTSKYSVYSNIISLPLNVQQFFRIEGICVSGALCFTTPDDSHFYSLCEFVPGNTQFVMDLYALSTEEMEEQIKETMCKMLFPQFMHPLVPMSTVESFKHFASIPYSPETHKYVVLLDWDKTCALSDGDCRQEQSHAFRAKYNIEGYMAITNEYFKHGMMLRPGLLKFFLRMMKVAHVCIITAGDLHYIRQTFIQGNNTGWLDEGEVAGEAPFIFPLTNVFSVRNHAKRAAPKTFARLIPFLSHLITGGSPLPIVAVDDDVGAWAYNDQANVIPISPFQPLNNSPEFLDRVATEIEHRVAMFYTKFAAIQPPAAVEP